MSSKEQDYLEFLGKEIAQELESWTFQKATDTAIWLDGPEGMGIVLWAGGGIWLEDLEETRIEVSGTYNLDSYVSPDEKPKSITMGVRKGAAAVARDIGRRFLSKYVPFYMGRLEVHKRIMRAREARKKVLINLAEAFGWKVVEDRDGLLQRVEESHRGSNLDAIFGNSLREGEEDGQWYVDLTLKRIPISLALNIAELMRETTYPAKQLPLL